MKRSISKSFLKQLKEGQFKDVINLIKVDPYLDLEMRGDSVIVYYRGGKILTIYDPEKFPKLKNLDYLDGLDPAYLKTNNQEMLKPNLSEMLLYFARAKNAVDIYQESSLNNLGEKEIQQRVISENNRLINSDETEFFIADSEWEENEIMKGRADLIAFHWGHSISEHKKKALTMYIIEIKQGRGAISSSRGGLKNENAGLSKHLDDYHNLVGCKKLMEEIKEDMLDVLKQKYELGFIKGLDKLFTVINGKILSQGVTINEQIGFVFLLANYPHYSKQLRNEMKYLPDDSLFFISSLQGYGLYKKFIIKKQELMDKYPFIFK